MRIALLCVLSACGGKSEAHAVVSRAVDALDRRDFATLEGLYVSAAQLESLVDCSKPTTLRLTPRDRGEELATIRKRAADYASEPNRHIKLVAFEAEDEGTREWHNYKTGDATDSICVARRPFRNEKYRVDLAFTSSFHGSTGSSSPIRLWYFDDRYWLDSDLLD